MMSGLWYRWYQMKDRCENPKNVSYKYYGEKGIRVCDEWQDFSKFEKWWSENVGEGKQEIDRIDSEKGYCPENCRIVTPKFNRQHKDKTVFYFGGMMTETEAAQSINVKQNTLRRYRLKNGKAEAEKMVKRKWQNELQNM